MTILEMIEEWERGCNTVEYPNPVDCKECTLALIQAIKNKVEAEAKALNETLSKYDGVSRLEDMSPDGSLTVMCQDDGDMCLSIFDGENFASVEFCTPFIGGGGSEKTWAKLRELMAAMLEDHNSSNKAREGRVFESE